LAKRIASYQGLWKQAAAAPETKELKAEAVAASPCSGAVTLVEKEPESEAAARATAATGIPNAKDFVAQDAGEGKASAQASAEAMETADQLEHRYRMIVLREHRYKLGRDLLELGHQSPWSLAWASLASFCRSFRPWAHARIFALACYLGVELTPEILKQLRHPLWIGRYRRSMYGLWRLLEMLAQKSGQKPASAFFFRLFHLCPPLAVLIYERQLQSMLRKTQDKQTMAAQVLAQAVQGQ
jgi:hypothetical protein